jgi:pyruvate/2-oxoglutarate dehydrogenase complex dihydrolipoamide acyltransferase (E2) component
MPNFIIDVPMPSMGATVSELTVINLAVVPGARVTKGQKLAELESDKSSFDFESPGDGTVIEIRARPGDVKTSGQTLFRLETADESLRHLAAPASPAAAVPGAPRSGILVWTPRAIKLAQEGGLDHTAVSDIEATGPGGRVSGDDVTKYFAQKK